ncbi:MAG: hypothetical protein IPN69_08060 [Acidobacteria bacterium]|nr:hypothetical protein [Acidobacteriota bacterium]
MKPKTLEALNEMVKIAARSKGIDPDTVEFEATVCDRDWCAASEDGAAEGDTPWHELLDFESLDAGQHPPEFPVEEND